MHVFVMGGVGRGKEGGSMFELRAFFISVYIQRKDIYTYTESRTTRKENKL